jgi:hypothetical protein
MKVNAKKEPILVHDNENSDQSNFEEHASEVYEHNLPLEEDQIDEDSPHTNR